jgi:hypothetical protein
MRSIKNLMVVADGQLAKRPVLKSGNASQKNKQAQLYELIFNNESVNEDQIARQLYGIKADSSSHNYIKLKSRLKQKLLDSLFFLEPNSKDLKQNVNATKQIYLGKVLYHLKVDDMAEKTIQKGMQAAIQIEHFDLAFSAAAQLLKIGFETNNMLLYQSSAKMVDLYEKLNQLQSSAQRRFFEAQLLIKSSASSEKISAFLNDSLLELEHQINVKEYFSFSILYFRNRHLKLIHHRDYVSVLENCLEAIDVLKQFENTPEEEIFYFKTAYLEACKCLHAYQKGNEFLARISIFENTKPFDDFKIVLHKYATLFNFGLQQYKDALSKTDLLLNSKSFKTLAADEKANWKLFKLYAELALYISTHDKSLKDDLHDVISSKSTKNVLKELEALSDDKHGNNVALKIVEIFIRLVKNETNTLIDKMEGFKTYKNRYLRLIEHKRANSFLSLVIGLEKNGFKADTISSLNDSNYQTLKVNTEQLISKAYEIVPFNHLWELIVDMLAEKKQVTRKAIY